MTDAQAVLLTIKISWPYVALIRFGLNTQALGTVSKYLGHNQLSSGLV
jgi:hypothetical protein